MQKYNVTGMSCAACSARVDKTVREIDGVEDVAVNLLTNTMNVEGDVDSQIIIDAVNAAGYGATLAEGETSSDGGTSSKPQTSEEFTKTQREEFKKIRTRLIVSLIFLLPMMYVTMGHMMWNWPVPEIFATNPMAVGIFEMLIAGIVMVINQKFFINGFKGIRHLAPNMDTLVAMGSGVSFGYSVVVLFQMSQAAMAGDMQGCHEFLHNLYFESAAMILTLITVGKMLESYSKGRTTDALAGLMDLTPQEARVVRDGVEIMVPVEQVKVDDIYVVKPGEAIPVDGVVISGNGAVDESALTGESIPVDKMENDDVTAATLNVDGHLTCRATRVGKDTTISQIIQMVSDSAATKAPIAKVADKVSGIFVPAVLLIALVTLIIWLLVGEDIGFSLARAISVLVISCPCALGLATPVAIMVGNGVGARNGILFKNATALENVGKTKVVVLDKTGTVTKGQPKVVDIVPADNVSKEELIKRAYAIEAPSTHPLARAIVDCMGNDEAGSHCNIDLMCTNFKNHSGQGVSGQVKGKMIYGGKAEFIRRKVGDAFDTFAKNHQVDEEAKRGRTPLFFATDDEMLGMISVADEIKEDSAEAIAELAAMGIETVMLTGDRIETARAIADEAGVKYVIAGVMPDEKAKVIKAISEHAKVMMVGDGINDAPALTAADNGVAIGAGADIAMDAAQVVLVESRLTDVVAAIKLSKYTLRNIHQNLFWAFFYNAICIPVAAGAWIHITGWEMNPMYGAAAMSMSSFCVVMNALRLNLYNIHKKVKNTEKANNISQENSKTFIQEIVDKYSVVDIIKEKGGNSIMKTTIKVDGMMCEHCEARVKEVLEALDGVASATPDHEANIVEMELDAPVTEYTFAKAITDAGYDFRGIKKQ